MSDMEHAIEKAAEVLNFDGACCGDCGREPGDPLSECAVCELLLTGYARVLAEAGLLAPAPLTEEQRSAHTVRETAAYFARRVQRIGDRINDRDYRRSLVDVLALESVQGFLDRIARDDLDVYAADRAERDGRTDQ